MQSQLLPDICLEGSAGQLQSHKFNHTELSSGGCSTPTHCAILWQVSVQNIAQWSSREKCKYPVVILENNTCGVCFGLFVGFFLLCLVLFCLFVVKKKKKK